MNEAAQQRLAEAIARKQRIQDALTALKSGGQIRSCLLDAEFERVCQKGNLAVENELNAMLREANSEVEAGSL